MPVLDIHTVDSAPEGSAPLLQSSIDLFGWIPNQSAFMAESPSLYESYQRAHELFDTSSLNAAERAVVWLTVGGIYRCSYTIGAHRYIALKQNVPFDIITAIESDPEKLSPRLAVLHQFTKIVALCAGQIPSDAISIFLSEGFTRANILDVILGVSQKTMSTLLNSVAKPELDSVFAAEWKRAVESS